MDLIKFGQTLSELLPRIKTKLQLSGLALGLVLGLFVHFAKPGDNVALVTAGSVGVSLVIFGQLFHFLRDFAQRDRPKVFLLSFVVFCVFTLSLLALTVLLVQKPTLSIMIYKPPPEVAERSAEYKYSDVDGVPTLKASFAYSVNSRRDLYPDADFHQAVSWGSPWLSFNIVNPSNAPLFFTSLKTDAIEIRLINEVILHVPEIDEATPMNAKLKLINEGWGKANNPTLEIRFARPTSGSQYVVVGQTNLTLDSFDEHAVIDLGGSLPPLSEWDQSDFEANEHCKAYRYLAVFGRLRYLDDAGAKQVETFRSHIYTCGSGGGNVAPSAFFNITLPHEKEGYPIFTPISNCISPNSADQLVVKLTAKRSVHLRLKFTLSTTSGLTVERIADVDVLIPRFDYQDTSRVGQFFTGSNKDGCT